MTEYENQSMTVAELIEKLRKLPQDYMVGEGTECHYFHPDNILVFHDTKEVFL